MLDFGWAYGLGATGLVGARLGDIEVDAGGDDWINVVGKGAKRGKEVLPPCWPGPRWMRDNLRHSSISTSSIYLHADDERRAKQFGGAFGVRRR